jgi:DNA-binding transcriptional MocR family regulator
VDQEVSKTLGELERKLQELERTLTSIDRGEQPGGDVPPRGAHNLLPVTPTDTHGGADAAPGGGYEQPSAAVTEPPQRSRLVDEAIERARTTVGTPPTWAEGPSRARPATAGEPRQSSWISRAPQPQRTAQPPEARTPGAEELLRFRDRLERTAHDLTQEYDELLGRLNFAAVPSQRVGPTISFARGAPSLDIVDVEGLRDAAARAFESDPAGTTAYGTSVGYPRLRAWIADRHGVEPERVLVTNGSMQADAFLFEQLVAPGDEVIVERPTYDRTLLSLRERGARLYAVELQPDGIDTDALAGLLRGDSNPPTPRPKLAHIIPNFQNPAGYTLSPAKRQALLALAAEHNFWVFEDDPYVDLRFSGETLPTMLSMDPEHVVYASSFSKTVCPGIRVGYLIGPPDLIAAVAKLATNTYISPSMVAQSIVYEFCASGAIDSSIETVRTALAKRALTLDVALRRELPEAEFVTPEGGYFMWVTLPAGTDVHTLHKAAGERGVSFVKGTDFLMEGGENTLRLAYSGVTPEQIDEGVTRLAQAYRSL